MSRDARCYPEPEEFRPERHLGIEVKAGEEYVLPSSFVFGFGRRCASAASSAREGILNVHFALFCAWTLCESGPVPDKLSRTPLSGSRSRTSSPCSTSCNPLTRQGKSTRLLRISHRLSRGQFYPGYSSAIPQTNLKSLDITVYVGVVSQSRSLAGSSRDPTAQSLF